MAVCSWLFCNMASGQCPINIDFEEGDFNLWTCYAGSFSNGNLVLSPSTVIPTRHKILSSVPGDGLDYWGGFPKNCPNGSGHSIQLGRFAGWGKGRRRVLCFYNTGRPDQIQLNLQLCYCTGGFRSYPGRTTPFDHRYKRPYYKQPGSLCLTQFCGG